MSGFQTDAVGPYIVSNPNDKRPYSLDWSDVLQTGETVSASVWTVPSPLAASSAGVASAVTTAIIACNGAPEATYRIYDEITTSLGNVLTRSFRLIVSIQA